MIHLWQPIRPSILSLAGLTFWPNWLERWLAILSVLSTQVQNPLGLLVLVRYTYNMHHTYMFTDFLYVLSYPGHMKYFAWWYNLYLLGKVQMFGPAVGHRCYNSHRTSNATTIKQKWTPVINVKIGTNMCTPDWGISFTNYDHLIYVKFNVHKSVIKKLACSLKYAYTRIALFVNTTTWIKEHAFCGFVTILLLWRKIP